MAVSMRVALPRFPEPARQDETGGGPRAGNDLAQTSLDSSASLARAAVTRARAAQSRWRFVSYAERVDLLTRAAKSMLERRAEVIVLAHEEGGKVEAEGMFNEALGPLDAVKSWAKVVRRATRREGVFLNPLSFPKKRAYVDLVPRGVVGIIAPWNYPVAGLYRSTLPALLTGNAIVVKPSEYTPRTSAWYAARLAEALPEGLVEVVQGDGLVGEALIDAGIDACVFTGSPETGKKVQIRCAERGVVVSAEMGGKDPAIVLSDCDLARTVAGVTHWSLSNAGQACGAIEIAYVDARIADAFVAALAAAWKKLRVSTERTADVGPLSNRRQFDVVVGQVEDARSRGAVVVCGGAPTGDGLCFAPTILDRCDESMAVVRDETFGPVLAVVRVEGAAEAVRRVNASRYGLGASIWTHDLARAERLAERLDVGVITVNNHSLSGAIPALPWSGTRDTGTGIANSAHALGTFVRPRATIVDRASAPEMYWMPYDDGLRRLGELLADAQLGRLGSAWRIPALLRARVRSLRGFFGMRR
jgi:acyl-CoA reductase-like NAD-dependent aldehyde dehydrogenase